MPCGQKRTLQQRLYRGSNLTRAWFSFSLHDTVQSSGLTDVPCVAVLESGLDRKGAAAAARVPGRVVAASIAALSRDRGYVQVVLDNLLHEACQVRVDMVLDNCQGATGSLATKHLHSSDVLKTHCQCALLFQASHTQSERMVSL